MCESYPKTMSELLVCIACLSTEVKMHSIHKYQLKTAYEDLTGFKVVSETFPQHLCSFCATLLLKCTSFKEKCLRAQELFSFALLQHPTVTTSHIRALDRSSFTLPYTVHLISEPHIKEEICPVPNLDNIIEENNHIENTENGYNLSTEYNESEVFKEDFHYSSDEEPLLKKVKKKRKLKKIKYENAKSDVLNFDDIEMVVLTKEEQIKEVEARKESMNYLNSLYKCDQCFKGFITGVTYRNHMIRHDPSSGPHVCDVCLSRWADARSLRSHRSVAHERKYICRACGDVSRSLHKAKEHSQWHKGYRFRCAVCGATFSKSTSHLTHVRVRHASVSAHACGRCGRAFLGAAGLSMHHKRAHAHHHHHHHQVTKTKTEYVCTQCGLQFMNTSALQVHLAGDGGSCDVSLRYCLECGEGFADEEQLSVHSRTQHCDQKVAVKCQHCERTFSDERSQALHYRRAHAALGAAPQRGAAPATSGQVCEVCGLKCTSKASLEHHQRIHTGEKPYACPDCPKRFSVCQRLQIHLRTHTGERPFKCSRCPKAFKHKAALNRHDRVHTGAKPYTCPHCGKSFSQSNSMKLHVRTVHLKMPAPYRNRKNKINEN